MANRLLYRAEQVLLTTAKIIQKALNKTHPCPDDFLHPALVLMTTNEI
ncbi:MAG: hypothetical protein AAFX78_05265 [Cyanobacteria bacterium J06638_20]